MHWRRKWKPTPVFLPEESQGQRNLVGCHLWSCTESDMTEATAAAAAAVNIYTFFYPFDFWWILSLLQSLDYCCDLIFENVLTINHASFPITHLPSFWRSDTLFFKTWTWRTNLSLLKVCDLFYFFLIWLHCTACRILVPQPETGHGCWAVNTQIPIHWPTRQFPVIYFLKFTNHYVSPKKMLE